MSRLGIFRKWKLSQKTLTPYSASCGGLWINFLFLSQFCHLLVYNIPGKVPKGAAWDISNRLRKGEVPPGLHHCCWFMADTVAFSCYSSLQTFSARLVFPQLSLPDIQIHISALLWTRKRKQSWYDFVLIGRLPLSPHLFIFFTCWRGSIKIISCY